MPKSLRLALAAAVGLASIAAVAPSPINPGYAQATFQEAKAICDRDGGRLWGHPLCGPILLVEPETRFVTANQPDAKGALTAAGPVFVGQLPDSENIANSPSQWSGVLWTELIWSTLPVDPAQRHVILAHEMFHRVQHDLGISVSDRGNAHLDTLEGRWLLQLEWRALSRALEASTAAERRGAITDALVFRADRYHRFKDAAAEEGALELMEGVAEYTGVRAGLETAQARNAYAVRDLWTHIGDPTFVRSFAYATGPAYGLLLDRADPNWRTKIKADVRFDQLLKAALAIRLPTGLDAAAKARAVKYDDGSLRAAEARRDADRQALLAAYKAKLVDGPVLNIPLRRMNVQFNPATLLPLEPYGTVYPSLRITDEWGVIEASDGALLRKDWGMVTVSAAHVSSSGLHGDGWTLKLKPGWKVAPGARKGDLELKADAPGSP
jgi:hypothetical protein